MKDEYIQPKEFISLLEQTHLILTCGKMGFKNSYGKLERIATIDSRSKNECEYVICASKSK